MYSVMEIARILDVAPRTVVRWIDEGRFGRFAKRQRRNGLRVVNWDDLQIFCDDHGVDFTADPDH